MQDRWPGWRFEVRHDLEAAEIISTDGQLVEFEAEYFNEDPTMALAHFIAHLDLHLEQLPDELSDEQCIHADFLAEVRLDRERDRIPL